MRNLRLAVIASLVALALPCVASADPHHGNQNAQNAQGNPHGCVNPAGNVRGWCKHGNGYTGYNGYGGYGNANVTISGIVTGVNGTTITILQGLSTRSIDASIAFQRGAVYGQLIPTRSITAVGYYDGAGNFHAVSIR